MTDRTVARVVKRAIIRAALADGLAPEEATALAGKFGGHSLRAGLATSAAMNDAPGHAIQPPATAHPVRYDHALHSGRTVVQAKRGRNGGPVRARGIVRVPRIGITPPSTHSSANIEPRVSFRLEILCFHRGCRRRPGAGLKQMQNGVRNESRARCVYVPIAAPGLLVHIKSLGDDNVELVLGPGHRHVEQAPLLFNLLGRTGGEIRRNSAIYCVQYIDRRPSCPLAE